jgi:hypothetical protein
MAAIPSIAWKERLFTGHENPAGSVENIKALEFTGVFQGRELTRKDRRLSSGLASIDSLLGGGIVRGRVTEITGPKSAGKTSIAVSFIASATRHGEAVAWIDHACAFDPATIASSGVDLARILWIHSQAPRRTNDLSQKSSLWNTVRAAEMVLEAGGALRLSTALRIARLAERTGAAIIVLAVHRMCGTFAAQSLALNCDRACFSRRAAGAPTLFDGFAIRARVARNKLGGVGAHATCHALIEKFPSSAKGPGVVPLPVFREGARG